ncbi:biopolymer transport protein ExbB/TolQ [Roseimicrobium gellanilyticum]|uniref:Biopolymer transport protein ExbB/TolQ n=1 Tax=Roseimicrobium gellanilyticum TaxID=748857 RepID=A0A366HGP5_9BACT|nr:MotA/TolQ/ExbB proton channel family protein [Roseimicrobium gellanilyticum]RBP41240.1 biopolymer transport protein ExbB/TolQ [Roseimicrobium gellanilyticum]
MKSGTVIHLTITASMLVAALLLIVILHFTLDPGGYAARLLQNRGVDAYPFTVQHVLWVVFFLGLGEILYRFIVSSREGRQLKLRYLSEDAHAAMLTPKNLEPVYARISRPASQGYFLPRLIQRIILMFQSSRSTDQAQSLLNTNLDLFMHEVDLGYNMLRYLMWLIPSLGFIGTVKGIGDALDVTGHSATTDPSLLMNVTKALAVAYDGTFLALMMTAVLLFAMHIIQGREEEIVNRSGQYCLDHLINRLHSGNQPQ